MLVAGGTIDFTVTNGLINKHRNKGLVSQLGNNWVILTTKAREVVDSQTSFLHIQPGVTEILEGTDLNHHVIISGLIQIFQNRMVIQVRLKI